MCLSVRDRLIPKNIFKVLKKGFFQNTQSEKICFVIILSVVLFRIALRINLQEIFQTEKIGTYTDTVFKKHAT